MSPEYSVVINNRTQKAEIEVGMLPGEDPKILRNELIIPHLAVSYLKYDGGFYKSMKTFSRIFPPHVAKKLIKAVCDRKVGARISFEKTGETSYRIIEEDLESKTSV